jgi:predicted ATPase
MVIRTPDQRLRVFVSSTLGELAEERQAVAQAISTLRLTPVMFELGARPHPPQELYRAYLQQSDVFIGLYWQRYGWVGPGMDISGLEEEFSLSGGLPRLLYVKEPAPGREPGLAGLLDRITTEASTSYRIFRTPEELDRLVRDDLATLLSERFTAGPSAAASSGRAPGTRPLPASTTSLIGRERAIGDVIGLLARQEVRLVTLTGPGGIGKTRLAVAVGERLEGRFGPDIAFVPLAAVTAPDRVLASIGRAAGADLSGIDSPLEALGERFGDDRWLVIPDNLEQVAGAAPDLSALLSRCPQLVILATSRTVLGVRAEREYPVLPLPLPADSAPADVLAATPAVALFVDRARAVRPGFALTDGNAATVAEICRRLEGLPLAIELAAARTRLLGLGSLLSRLTASLDALGTGAVDLPERQRTLRATVQWSVGLLDDAERSLLETAAVFVDGWTLQAAAQVAVLDEDRVLELSEALARHSLIYIDSTGPEPRSRMLETIRAFVAERLAARPDVAEIQHRHAEYYRALGEQADRPLRGTGHREWLEQLEAEAGNVAAAVRWYLAHDPAPLPHLLRVLWSFWFLRDHEGRSWVAQLLPAADSFDPQAQAELAWTALLAAMETGDDAAALAARNRLTPLLPGIEDPFLHAICQLGVAWTSPITGDLEGALQEGSDSLNQLRGLDEPFWTALAVGSLGGVETALGRYQDALRHLREACDLADRLGSDPLAAYSQVQLGTLEVGEGRLDEARPLLDEALEMGAAAHSTRSVALCLAAFARLALADGDPERTALLAGAARGLRQRAGLQAWPTQRRAEDELVAKGRQALGTGRFDQVFAVGTRLSQRDAVAAARDGDGIQTS